MKTFPSKVEWIAEHRNGDKCYYYPGTGWVNAANGLVRSFDVDFEEIEATPEGATHVQIVNGKVQYVRCVEASVCVDIWRSGWQQACTLPKLRGTVVRIADSSVYGSGGTQARIQPEAPWVDVAYNQRPQGLQNATLLEVDYGLGGTAHCAVCDAIWADVKRWRYAS